MKTALLIVGLLICLASCQEDAAAPAPAEDRLPAYPRRSLIDLRDALALGHGERDRKPEFGEPFVVTGTVARAPNGFLLMEDTAVCCVAITVGFEVDGDPRSEGKRVAVFGRLVRDENTAPDTRLQPSPAGFKLIVEGYVIEPERIVPAERLVKRDNVIDLMTSESLSIFARALRETNVAEVLRSAEAITILVPVDQAFPDPEAMFRPENREQLRLMVLRHVIPEKLRERELMDRDKVTAMTLEEFAVRVENGSVRIAGARTLFENIVGSNGVLHMIHKVLQPEDAVRAARKR